MCCCSSRMTCALIYSEVRSVVLVVDRMVFKVEKDDGRDEMMAKVRSLSSRVRLVTDV